MNAVHSNVRKRPVWKIFVKGENNWNEFINKKGASELKVYDYTVGKNKKFKLIMAMTINHNGSKYMVERNVDNCKDDGTYKYVVRQKGKATSHYTSNLDEKIDFVQAFEF